MSKNKLDIVPHHSPSAADKGYDKKRRFATKVSQLMLTTVMSNEAAQVNGTNGTMAPALNNDTTTTNAGQSLSADEIALYDRQIRLWGAQAQERIRSANILLVSLRALGTEIAKNLTLAGISSLTIIDEDPVTEDDLGAGYFLRQEDVGKPVSAAHFHPPHTSEAR